MGLFETMGEIFRPEQPKFDLSKVDNIQLTNVCIADYPDFVDAYIIAADYNGVEMSGEQLNELNKYEEFIHDQVMKFLH